MVFQRPVVILHVSRRGRPLTASCVELTTGSVSGAPDIFLRLMMSRVDLVELSDL